MLEMISFWVYYGMLMVMWFGFATYWSVSIIDKYLENLTNGDLKDYLCNRFRNPFLKKLGLMDTVDCWGYPSQHGEWRYLFNDNHLGSNNKGRAVFIFLLSFLGMVFAAMAVIAGFNSEDGINLHTVTVKLATFMTEVATTPLLIGLSLVGLHATLKKVYQFGKKIKPLVDSINKEEK